MQQMALVMQKQMHMQQQGGAGPLPDPSGMPMNVNLMQQQLQGQLVPSCSCATKPSLQLFQQMITSCNASIIKA